MVYRSGHSFRVPMLILVLTVVVQFSGCAATPATSSPQFITSQQWSRNVEGDYVHVSGRVISEAQYGQIVADEVSGQFHSAAKKIPKKCKRKVQY